jgi:hypothetical protein
LDEADGAIVEIEPADTEEAQPYIDMEVDGPARGDIKEVDVISSDEDGYTDYSHVYFLEEADVCIIVVVVVINISMYVFMYVCMDLPSIRLVSSCRGYVTVAQY